MLMTVRNAWKFVNEIENPEPDFGTVAVHFAKGAIRGSRGNSGTILSELLRGFANEVSSLHEADITILKKAFRSAVKLAYTVVEKPVEGTILTVARRVADEIETSAEQTTDLVELLRRASHQAQLAVAETPELLPILRKAGVVDSGAQGLAYLFEGMCRHAMGETLEIKGGDLIDSAVPGNLAETLKSEDARGYGYDVQYLLEGKNLDIETIRAAIGSMGDSMVVTGDDSVVKVHIHVHDPGIPLSYGVSLGIISDVVVENMQLQSEQYVASREAQSPAVNPGDIGVVAVSPGEGISRILRSMGVSVVISGGQSMNPSSGELVDAINLLNTDKVIVLPNNKNIILTAEQAAKEIEGKQVTIIPTRTVPQGIAAMLSFNAEGDLSSIGSQMNSAKDGVITGELTTASRSVAMDGVDVTEGQIIGLIDGKLAVSGAEIGETLRALLGKMIRASHELVTLYYGADVTEAAANAAADELRTAFPNVEFDVAQGSQPYYFYLISVE